VIDAAGCFESEFARHAGKDGGKEVSETSLNYKLQSLTPFWPRSDLRIIPAECLFPRPRCGAAEPAEFYYSILYFFLK
jgi:hypothetical protein